MDNVPPTHDLGNGQEMEPDQLWDLMIKYLEDRLAAKGQQLPGNHLSFLARVLETEVNGRGNKTLTLIDRASGIIPEHNLMHYLDILAERPTKIQVSPQEDSTDGSILVTNDPKSATLESAELEDSKELKQDSRSKAWSAKDTDASLPKAEGAVDTTGRPTGCELEKECRSTR